MSNRPTSHSEKNDGRLYGLHPVTEALRAKRRTVEEVLVDEKAPADRFREIRRLAEQQNAKVYPCSKHDLFESCGSRQHQGVVLVGSPFPYSPLTDDIFEQPRLLLLDNLEDPRNTGAILRSADLFGFSTILLPKKGGAGVYPSVVKTSAGASEHLTVVREANSTTYFKRAASAGYRTVALDAGGDIPLSDVPVKDSRPLFLILGGEDKRIGQYLLNSADIVARIPQQGHINSLNASVAAGIALFHVTGGSTA
jgi:23S rRNA (guanosine2251-2'-O)-methyltransferase